MWQIHPWKTSMQKTSSLLFIVSGRGEAPANTQQRRHAAAQAFNRWCADGGRRTAGSKVICEVKTWRFIFAECEWSYVCENSLAGCWSFCSSSNPKSQFTWRTKLGLKCKNYREADWTYSCLLKLIPKVVTVLLISTHELLRRGKWTQSPKHGPSNLNARVCLTQPSNDSCPCSENVFAQVLRWRPSFSSAAEAGIRPLKLSRAASNWNYSLKWRLQFPLSRPHWAKAFPFSIHYWFLSLFLSI